MISDYAEGARSGMPLLPYPAVGETENRSPDHLSPNLQSCHRALRVITFCVPVFVSPEPKGSSVGAFVFCQTFVRAHASRIAISADHRSRCVRINHLSSTISREYDDSCTTIFSVLSTLRGGQKVTETVTYTRYLASGTCLTLCTHRQYTGGGGGDRKPRTKSF